MAKGDALLVLSMLLMLAGTGLFLGSFGSTLWVADTVQNSSTHHYGLWRVCHNGSSSACSIIDSGSPKAYFQVTRVFACLALVAYGLALLSCFTADDRYALDSCRICVQRYCHVVASLTAGGLSCISIFVFAACYEADDWFFQPELGHSFWLAFVGSTSSIGAGVLRILFIVWPGRPSLPMRKRSRKKAAAKARKKGLFKKQPDEESDSLPGLQGSKGPMPPLRIQSDTHPPTKAKLGKVHPSVARSNNTENRSLHRENLFARWFHERSRTTIAASKDNSGKQPGGVEISNTRGQHTDVDINNPTEQHSDVDVDNTRGEHDAVIVDSTREQHTDADVDNTRGQHADMDMDTRPEPFTAPNRVYQTQRPEGMAGADTSVLNFSSSDHTSIKQQTPDTRVESEDIERKTHSRAADRVKGGLAKGKNAAGAEKKQVRIAKPGVLAPAQVDLPDNLRGNEVHDDDDGGPDVTPYQLALDGEDLEQRGVSQPPHVVRPPVHVYGMMDNVTVLEVCVNTWKKKLHY